jgi:hypothetical protein
MNGLWIMEWAIIMDPRDINLRFLNVCIQHTDYLDLRVDVTSGEQEESDYHFVFCNNCFDGSMLRVFVYPNPSDDLMTINEEEPKTFTDNTISKNKKSDYLSGQSDQAKDEVVYTLYNNLGQAVYIINTEEKTVRIKTSSLQEVYYISENNL